MRSDERNFLEREIRKKFQNVLYDAGKKKVKEVVNGIEMALMKNPPNKAKLTFVVSFTLTAGEIREMLKGFRSQKSYTA